MQFMSTQWKVSGHYYDHGCLEEMPEMVSALQDHTLMSKPDLAKMKLIRQSPLQFEQGRQNFSGLNIQAWV